MEALSETIKSIILAIIAFGSVGISPLHIHSTLIIITVTLIILAGVIKLIEKYKLEKYLFAISSGIALIYCFFYLSQMAIAAIILGLLYLGMAVWAIQISMFEVAES